ncbi:putative tryptophan transport protein [Clostridium acetireducens DSM 10703]|jgi:hypothetical protein|uniref:Putative tryptophan transport protein n=1 Tax=Clostridium acetireducens DSM 10703 TaxID=1121290 RepID=A0A1E8EX32_9CLOT|nr:tryptophan transporter [Clostridium acetireducens]OFI01558.1 putative tryptophan transport protein [Clostridium acetireducens DSM 10703]
MNLKKSIISSLFLAIGLILHQISPPLLMGMKPDFLLAMLFIALFINNDYKNVVIISIVAGILTAATTTFPGGQIPNIIDKLITCQCLYVICKLVKNINNDYIKVGLVSIIGTLISGTTFLVSALFLFGLPAPLSVLMVTVVLPATVINFIATTLLYGAVKVALKHTAY